MLNLRRGPDIAGFPVCEGGLPVVGHLWNVYRDMPGFCRQAERELGPFFWAPMGFGRKDLFCTLPEAFDLFKNRTTSSANLGDQAGPFLGHHSLIVHDGAPHRHMRGALTPPFTPKGLSAVDVAPVLAEVIAGRVDRWVRQPEVAIARETRELALALIFRMLGIPEHDLAAWRHHYEEFILGALQIPYTFPGTPAWRARRAQTWLDARLRTLIADLRERSDAPGFLARLVHGRDEDGHGLSDDELLDNIRLLALAGHETTASVMAWLVLVLAHHPEQWARLRDEATAADGVPTSPQALRGFPFAEGLFREVLRLWSPVPMDGRRVSAETTIGGRALPVGADVIIPIAHLSRHPAVHDDPDTLRPDRWLQRHGPPGGIETIQFGGGPHFCLGYHLAWMEVVQLAVTLARGLAAAGKRPAPAGPFPTGRYMPVHKPDPRARVRFV